MKPQHFLPTGDVWDGMLSYLNSWRRLGYRPRVRHPRTFNEFFLHEKLQFDLDEELARTLTDKAEFKLHLSKIGLESSVVPTLHLATNIEFLRTTVMPSGCVIKPTHGSGDLLLLREEQPRILSEGELAMIGRWLKEDYYIRGREPNYKGIAPRIIVEPMLRDSDGNPPRDFKIFCVRGEPFLIQVDHGRFERHTRQLYDPDWTLTPFTMFYPRHPDPILKPAQLAKAFEICKLLSSNMNLSRVDFYFLGDKQVYIGELTFFPGNCAEPFSPPEADFVLGDRIKTLMRL